MTAETTRSRLPLPDPYIHEEPRKITKEEHEFKAYRALRDGRAQARHEGKRKVRAQKVRAPPSRVFHHQILTHATYTEEGGGSCQDQVKGLPLAAFFGGIPGQLAMRGIRLWPLPCTASVSMLPKPLALCQAYAEQSYGKYTQTINYG